MYVFQLIYEIIYHVVLLIRCKFVYAVSLQLPIEINLLIRHFVYKFYRTKGTKRKNNRHFGRHNLLKIGLIPLDHINRHIK